jgi:hypothetical protein
VPSGCTGRAQYHEPQSRLKSVTFKCVSSVNWFVTDVAGNTGLAHALRLQECRN